MPHGVPRWRNWPGSRAGILKARASGRAADAEDIGTGFRVAGEARSALAALPGAVADPRGGMARHRRGRRPARRSDVSGCSPISMARPGWSPTGRCPPRSSPATPSSCRPLTRLVPPGGCHLQAVAIDLGRGPRRHGACSPIISGAGGRRLCARGPAGDGADAGRASGPAQHYPAGPVLRRLSRRAGRALPAGRAAHRAAHARPARSEAMPNRRISPAISAGCSSRAAISRCSTTGSMSAPSPG